MHTKKCVLWLRNTLVILSSLIYTLSCNQNTILIHLFIQLCYLSHSWPNFNIFGIKKYKIELKKSFEILSNTLIYSITHIHAIKMQFSHNFSQNLAFFTIFNTLCTKKIVLIIRIILLILSYTYSHIFAQFNIQFGNFSQF